MRCRCGPAEFYELHRGLASDAALLRPGASGPWSQNTRRRAVNKIEYSLIPFAPLMQKIVGALTSVQQCHKEAFDLLCSLQDRRPTIPYLELLGGEGRLQNVGCTKEVGCVLGFFQAYAGEAS